MNYPSPFPTFATIVLNQLAASLWLSLLRSFPVTDTLGLMLLEQLAFAHWAASELARKQSRDLATGADADSPAILRLSRERRAECRLQTQLARQLNQHLRAQATPEHTKKSTPDHNSVLSDEKMSKVSHSSSVIAAIAATMPTTYVRPTPKVGRNEPCPCQSGRKFKHCCSHQPLARTAGLAA